MISHVICAWPGTWTVYDQPRDQCIIATWSVHDQSSDHCMISHMISAWMPRDQCMNSHVISAWWVMWSVWESNWSAKTNKQKWCNSNSPACFLNKGLFTLQSIGSSYEVIVRLLIWTVLVRDVQPLVLFKSVSPFVHFGQGSDYSYILPVEVFFHTESKSKIFGFFLFFFFFWNKNNSDKDTKAQKHVGSSWGGPGRKPACSHGWWQNTAVETVLCTADGFCLG